MTTDNKTLADVQPGGRVRLGDQRSDLVPGIVRCAKCQFQLARSNLNMHSGTVTAGDSKTEPCPNGCGPLWPVTWETWAREGWAEAERLHLENAALSAQPSPGGQGDAITPAMVDAAASVLARWAGHDDGSRWVHEARDALEAALAARQLVDDRFPGGFADAIAYVNQIEELAEGIHTQVFGHESDGETGATTVLQMVSYQLAEKPAQAIDARQPVGEPVAWMTHHDEPMLFPTAAEAAAYCEDDEQPVPLFRSPAQAVDLGQLQRFDHQLFENPWPYSGMEDAVEGNWVRFDDVKALIDKAVGK